MNDKNGHPLNPGDTVLVQAEVAGTERGKLMLRVKPAPGTDYSRFMLAFPDVCEKVYSADAPIVAEEDGNIGRTR